MTKELTCHGCYHKIPNDFINFCESNDLSCFMEYEQIFKNAEPTDEGCTLPKEDEKTIGVDGK